MKLKVKIMLQIKQKHNCSGCSACSNICPKNCIEMKADEEGFLYPVIDEERCIKCGLCKRICPILNKSDKASKVAELPKTYACINKDEKISMLTVAIGIDSDGAPGFRSR